MSLHCVAASLLSCLQASGWGSWGQDGWGVCPVETVSILRAGLVVLALSPLPPAPALLLASGSLWAPARMAGLPPHPPTQAALHPSGASVVPPSSLFSFLPFTSSSSFSWCFCLSSWFQCRRTQVAFRHLVQQQAAKRPRPPSTANVPPVPSRACTCAAVLSPIPWALSTWRGEGTGHPSVWSGRVTV